MTEIEELRAKNPDLAERMIALAKELEPFGGRLKIAMVGAEVETAPVVPPILNVEPVKGELTKDQVASWLRAGMTALGAILGTLGVVEPQVYEGWIGKNFAILLSLALALAPRAHSWWEARKAARIKAQQIEVARTLPQNAKRIDGTPLTPTDVAKITAVRVETAKKEALTPVEALIDERRSAPNDAVRSPVDRIIDEKKEGAQ